MVKRALVASLLLACGAVWCQQPVAVGKVDDSAKNYRSAGGGVLSSHSTDAELARSLDETFSNNPQFANIQVAVKHHRVVLTGTVVSKDAKQRAETVAQNTEGVRSVRDRLKVRATSAVETAAQ